MLKTKQTAKVASMVEQYNLLRQQSFNHAAAAHAVISQTRHPQKHELITAFFADVHVAAEAKKFAAEIEL